MTTTRRQLLTEKAGISSETLSTSIKSIMVKPEWHKVVTLLLTTYWCIYFTWLCPKKAISAFNCKNSQTHKIQEEHLFMLERFLSEWQKYFFFIFLFFLLDESLLLYSIKQLCIIKGRCESLENKTVPPTLFILSMKAATTIDRTKNQRNNL